MKHIVFLASGNGGNLKFFYLAQKNNFISGIRLTVVADRECGSIDFARRNGLEHYVIKYERSDAKELTNILGRVKPDIIVTNWHKIIDQDTLAKYLGKFVNLHYSLLPAFAGLIGVEPIKRSYQQGCKFIGPTCHLLDEGVDTGKILSQAIFTTEKPFEDAVNLMFRKGCLVLLSGIQQILGKNISTACAVVSEGSYSPPLGFDESLFNEQFWKEISIA
jgi:phosphoribosylglycinamide formyltransferase-1